MEAAAPLATASLSQQQIDPQIIAKQLLAAATAAASTPVDVAAALKRVADVGRELSAAAQEREALKALVESLRSELSQQRGECRRLEEELAALKSRPAQANSPANAALTTPAKPGAAAATLSSPLQLLQSPAAPPTPAQIRSAVQIQRVFRGHLDRQALDEERRLSQLPIDTPSTPAKTPSRPGPPPSVAKALASTLASAAKLPQLASAVKPAPEPVAKPLPPPQPLPVAEVPIKPAPPSVVKPPAPAPAPVETPAHRHTLSSSSSGSNGAPTATPAPAAAPTLESAQPLRKEAAAVKTVAPRPMSKLRAPQSFAADAEAKEQTAAPHAAVHVRSGSGSSGAPQGPPLSPTKEKTLLSELRKACVVLRDIEPAWSLRVKAINRIEALVHEDGIARGSGFWAEFDSVIKCLAVQLEDLRSSIVREACRALVALADAIGQTEQFADLLVVMLPVLFRRLYVTIKCISEGADECVKAMLARAISPHSMRRCVARIVAVGLSDSHAIVRRRCVEYVTMFAQRAAASGSLASLFSEHQAEVMQLLKTQINDGDKDVRAAGRALFVALEPLWPSKTAEVATSLSSVVLKSIDAERKKA